MPNCSGSQIRCSKEAGGNVITKGVNKPGTVGECTIKFEFDRNLFIEPQT